MLILERPWTRQPPGIVGLNKSHWLAKDILFAHSGQCAIINGAPVVNSQLLAATVNAGNNPALNNARGWSATGAGSFPSWSLPLALTYPITLSAWFYGTAGTTTDAVLYVTRTGGGTGTQYLGRSPAELPIALSENSGGSSNSAATTAYTFAANTWVHAVAVFRSNSSRTIYANGVVGSTATGAIAMPSDLTVVNILGNNRTVIGGVALPMIINRELTADDVFGLYSEQRSNPWQLFASQQIIIPTPAAAGYTHPTLSLATATEITATGFKPRVTYTFA